MYQYPTFLNVLFVQDSGQVISLPCGQYLTVCVMADRLPKNALLFAQA